jgi:beta-lactamase regulating signal transducer with metallopeptidase domain
MNSEWMIRALVAGVLFACAALAAERVFSWYARPRRGTWVVAMVLSVCMPALAWYAPAVIPGIQLIERPLEQASSVNVVQQIGGAWSVTTRPVPAPQRVRADESVRAAARVAWPLASIVLLMSVLAAYLRLRAIRARAPETLIDGVAVRLTDRTGPAVVGFLHPTIVLPAWVGNATDAERSMIVLHEREHIDARDHWLMAFGTLALVAMPWNVALWWQYAQLRLAIETDCDARVVARGADRDLYGRTLIRSAGHVRTPSLLAPALGDPVRHLRRRILAMTARPPRARFLRGAPYAMVAALLGFVACQANARPVAPIARSQSVPSRSHIITVRGDATGSRHVSQGAEAPQPPPSALQLARTFPLAPEISRTSAEVMGLAHIRVTGYSRRQVRAQITLVSAGGKLVLLNSALVLRSRGDTIVDVITPAEFRVDGATVYSVVAAVMEAGAEVEIAGTAPRAEDRPSAASARGPAPMLSFRGENVAATAIGVDRAMQVVRARLDSLMTSQVVPPPASSAPTNDLPPGRIRIEAESGEHVRVRVDLVGIGGFNLRGGSMSSDRANNILIVTTPATVDIPRNASYTVRFVAVNPNVMLLLTANGGDGHGVRTTGGRYQGAVIFCRSAGGEGVGGVSNEALALPPVCPW